MKLFKFEELARSVVASTPQLRRGRVWCHTCGHTEAVDSATCLASGWPTHCGQTMSIDSPEERKAQEFTRG